MRRRRANRQIREVGRDVYVEANGDLKRCREIVEGNPDKYGFLGELLIVIQILLTLWEFWHSKGIKSPPASVQVGEPYDWEDND